MITINTNKPPNRFYGKYYISRPIDADDNVYFTDREEYGWAAEVGLNLEYLHPDGVWRRSTKNEHGEFTGYYDDLETAEEVSRKA